MLSDAHVEAANNAIRQVFETTSVAWRTIPHWFTGDPGRTAIRSDSWYAFPDYGTANNPPPPPTIPPLLADAPLSAGPYGGQPATIGGQSAPVNVTLAEATATTADQVVAAASAIATEVVRAFDSDVASALAIPALQWDPDADRSYHVKEAPTVFDGPKVPSTQLLDTRATLEQAGYHGSRSVWAGAEYFEAFHQVDDNNRLILPACASLLHLSSIHRWTPNGANSDLTFDDLKTPVPKTQPIAQTMIVIGRRQEIPPGRAFDAAPGPEPIDLAVAVAPSLEIVGSDAAGNINLRVRIRYALRFKDNRAVVVWTP